MAKKKPAKKSHKIVSKPRKIIPAMYPPPEPVELPPRKIVAVDAETRTITLEGPTPPELLKAAEVERERLDLKLRLATYCETCLNRMEPYWGKRPEKTPRSKWLAQKLLTPGEREDRVIPLPEDSPAEIQDAHSALVAMQWILRCLEAEGPVSRRMSIAICMAIDLGQLLQRGQVQIDHGEAVDRGKRNIKSTDEATATKKNRRYARSEAARIEFERRKTATPRLHDQDILNNMASEMANGKPRWGAIATLNRYKPTWRILKPSE